MCRRKSFAFLPAFFFFNLDQDDIGTNLADTFPGNDVFGIAAEKTADLCRTGNNDCFHKSGTDIDIHIAYTAKRTAGTGVDHFFLPQFTDSHKIPTPSFEIERTDRCTQDSRCFRKVFFSIVYAIRAEEVPLFAGMHSLERCIDSKNRIRYTSH